MSNPLVIRGLYPAVSVPFDAGYRVVEDEFRDLIRTIDAAPGVGGVAVNGHAGELPSLTATDRARLIRLARETLSPGKIVIGGVDGPTVDASLEQLTAIRDAGADAALVLPAPFDHGPRSRVTRTAEAPLRYFSAIASAGLPIVVYRYGTPSRASYSIDTLVALAEIDEVVAVKFGEPDSQVYQEGVEALSGTLPILTSGDTPQLLGNMLLGCQGTLVGAGQIAPELWGRYVNHVLADEVHQARAVFLRHLLPILTHIYTGRFDTMASSNARAKEALVQLGIYTSSRVRPPELDVTDIDRQRVRIGLDRAHLLPEPARA